MKMVTKVALANAKYHKSKNFLVGVAIVLTTLLLFLVPTIGFGMINCQHAVVNETYPTFHALFRNVSEDTAKKLSAHHLVDTYGLRSDLGQMDVKDAEIPMMYMDANAFEMYHIELKKGNLPQKSNEIVVSPGILKELNQSGDVGDTITVPYQAYCEGGLDYTKDKKFTICGMLEDSDVSLKQRTYTAFVSEKLLKEEFKEEGLSYRFLFRVSQQGVRTTDEMEERVQQLAGEFHIKDQDLKINEDYLGANYVDPAFVPGIVLIMLIIVVAGVITIYSIYYISMDERVREYGKIKAIGATTKQLKKIVLHEGMLVASVGIPVGLLIGSFATKAVYLGMFRLYQEQNDMVEMMEKVLADGKVHLLQPEFYILAIVVAFVTVYVSLCRPMRIAAKVSEIDAMRYQGETGKKKKARKGYDTITIGRMTKVYLSGNKKKSVITICSMAITGLFFMVVATVLSCANPKDSADYSMMSEYVIRPVTEHGNKEAPELEWNEVQKNNPITEEFKDALLQIDGIKGIECCKAANTFGDVFGEEPEGLIGIPESEKNIITKGIVEGDVTYEELCVGNKVVIDKKLLYWYPELKVGDVLELTMEDGEGKKTIPLEIAAVGEYTLGFTNYHYLIMANEGIQKLSDNNLDYYLRIYANKKYDAKVESAIKALAESYGKMEVGDWQNRYKEAESGIRMTRADCYGFLGILGAICIMNMINTMIHNVHVRKIELGMLQAVGMTDRQLLKMLQSESLFYTMGTLLVAIGGGSIVGYFTYLWAKKEHMFNITNYHYPAMGALVVTLVLFAVQFLLTLALSKSTKKESVIERIRFSE